MDAAGRRGRGGGRGTRQEDRQGARSIHRIIPTPPDQLFVLAHIAPLSYLSLLVRIGVRVSVRVNIQPTADDPPPRGNVVPTVEVVKRKPRYPSHEEAEVQVEGAGLLFVLVCIYPLHTGE